MRLDTAFARGRHEQRPLVVPFVTAGFPELESTLAVVRSMAAAGADLIEIGIPFSDPLADGPTIQKASERALANGVTVAWVLETVRQLRADNQLADVPVLLMGYCNPIFQFGLEAFLEAAAAAGVDGLIVPDLPPEESEAYRDGCARHGLAAVFLMAPNAPDDRIRLVDSCSSHFSYCVTITGVTGARGELEDRTVAFLERVGRLAAKPFVVGFGIKEPAHVLRLGAHAAGVVVGSALIDAIDAAPDAAAAAADRVAALRAAAEQVGRQSRAGSARHNVPDS